MSPLDHMPLRKVQLRRSLRIRQSGGVSNVGNQAIGRHARPNPTAA
ncbi:hypothetical protein [Lentzea sp.]|nr:hypothetical protein [Lentzea sp.]HUQ54665.1 hypothetical protein [Lentzea sp.]